MVVAALPADNSSQGQPEGDDCSGASSGNGTPGRCQGAQGTENRRMSFINHLHKDFLFKTTKAFAHGLKPSL